MKMPSDKIVQMLREQYPVGSRVELVRMEDFQAPPIGTRGTVQGVDDMGSILVAWDNGCGLNVVYGEDKCVRVFDEEETWKEGIIAIPKSKGGASIIRYWVKVESKATNVGINQGKISELRLKMDGDWIAVYDMVWIVEPTCQQANLALCILLNDYN